MSVRLLYGFGALDRTIAQRCCGRCAGAAVGLDYLLEQLGKYEAGWMTSYTGYSDVAEAKRAARAALEAFLAQHAAERDA